MDTIATLVDRPNESLCHAWQDLLKNNPRSTVFQHPRWVVPEGQAFKDAGGLVMRFDRSDTLAGIAPMCVHRRVDTLKHLRFIGGDYEDIVYEPDREIEAVQALLRGMQRHRRSWDIANFKSLRPQSILLNPFIGTDGTFNPCPPSLADDLKGLNVICEPHHRSAYIRLPRSWDEYELHLGKKFSWQLNYEERRRHREFKSVEIRTASHSTLEKDLDIFYRLHTERRIAKGYLPHFDQEAVRQSFASISRGLLDVDQLRLYTLLLDGEAAGSVYLLTDSHRIYYYGSGFDSAYEKHGPVKALMMHAIKTGIADGMSEFDFLKGEGDYRTKWATDFRQLYRLYIAQASLRPWLVMKLRGIQQSSHPRNNCPEPAYITINA